LVDFYFSNISYLAVVVVFKIKLDIQEFYETILLDDQSDRAAKMKATLHLAEEWERQPMLKQETRVENYAFIFTLIILLYRMLHQQIMNQQQ